MSVSRRGLVVGLAIVAAVVIVAVLFYLLFLGNQITTPLPGVQP